MQGHPRCRVLIALLFGWTVAVAQEPPPPLELGIEEEVEVRLVLVDLLALDRDDRPVPDLTADELELSVDGRKIEIATFDRDCPALAAADPRDFGRTPHPGKIVLVFDYYHMTNVAETYERVLETLDTQPAGGAEHMVVSLGDVVRIETPFTTDLGEVRLALRRMRDDPALWAGNHGRLTEWPFFERVGMLFDLLERIAGRKTVVLFSGPFTPDGFFHDPAHKQLSAMSTIARTAIYAVDAGGLRTGPGHLGGPGELRRLASETGGRMTADTNDIGLAYARARRDLGCRYTLGFHDRRPRADDKRRLTLRVARSGVRIVYPEFYVLRSPATKRESLLATAAMTPQMFSSDSLSAELFLLGPLSKHRWRALLAVELRLDPDEIVEEGEEWLLKGLLRKPNGTLLRSFERTVPMPRGGGVVVTMFKSLSVAPGQYVVSALLADPEAGAPRAASLPVEVLEVPDGARQAPDALALVCVANAETAIDLRTLADEVSKGGLARLAGVQCATMDGRGGGNVGLGPPVDRDRSRGIRR